MISIQELRKEFPVDFIPRTTLLDVGLSVVRLERCEHCRQDTRHTFTLIQNRPRYWVYQCHVCSQRRQKEEGN